MNYRERIRKWIECPQFSNETYGEWGALNLEQRKYIKRLLDELDRADNYIKSVYLENKQLKDNWNKLKEHIGAEWYCFDNESIEFEVAKDILNKMIELEQGSGSNGNRGNNKFMEQI